MNPTERSIVAEMVYEKIDKSSEDLVVGDEFRIGDVLTKIALKKINDKGDLILHLDIVGATVKKRSKMMLILPTKIPIETLK